MPSKSSIFTTGGTGLFGHTFVPMMQAKRRPVICSRDEMKQWGMAKLYVNDFRVMVLGEAISALDTAIVEHCDRLCRVEQGRMAEEGCPDTMLHQQPRSITRAQA